MEERKVAVPNHDVKKNGKFFKAQVHLCYRFVGFFLPVFSYFYFFFTLFTFFGASSERVRSVTTCFNVHEKRMIRGRAVGIVRTARCY